MGTNLRETKRAMLRSSIERAAVALVREHGYDNVTVDMICEASLASQRTFFNYFGSKEAAVLGPPPETPDPAVVDDFVHHPQGPVLEDLTRMMARVLERHGDVDHALWQDRREVIRHNPVLMRAQADRIAAKDTELTAIVTRRLDAHRADHGAGAAADLTDQARLIVSMWWGIARHGIHLWAEHPTASSQQIVDDLLCLLDRIKEA